ncbi:MAG: GAF domain-containing sensor histidine kinase [Chitinophagales bacterium]
MRKDTSSKSLNERILQLEEKEKHLSVINSFANEILQQNDIDEILWAIAKNAIAKLGFVDCVIYLIDKEENILIQKAAHGGKNPKETEIKNQISIPIGSGIVGTVAATGQAEIIADTSKDKRYITDDENRLSEIAVPIFANNQVIGVIDSEHPQKDFFTTYHLETLQTIASMSSVRIMNAIAHQELEKHKNELKEIVSLRTADLSDTISKLKNSNENLERYAHTVSHDLKQPIRTINNFITLIKATEKNLSPNSIQYVELITSSIEKITKLLDELLEYASLSENSIQKSKVNINDILDTVEQNLTKQIIDASSSITKEKMPSIDGYESLLIQLFQNLISNALKFRQEAVPHQIKITVTEEDEFYCFKVIDNGIGIDICKEKNAFNIFTRLHDTKKYEGTGLGLSLCKKIVDIHQGTINVESQGKNQGCTFHFTLKK